MSFRIERSPPGADSEDDDNQKNPTASPPLTPPQIIAKACHTLMDPASDRSLRLETCQKLERMSSQVDAYVTMRNISQARGPPLDWSLFRKAYSVVLWIKPNVSATATSTTSGDSSDSNNSKLAYDRSPSIERCLYRFATEPTMTTKDFGSSSSSFTAQQQNKCAGVVVHTSPWVLVDDNNNTYKSSRTSDSSDNKNNSVIVETILTAMTLPCLETLTNSNSQTNRRVSYPLRLRANEWHLVCCSHVCPYLKRPQWSVAVDGHTLFTKELEYPALGMTVSAKLSSDAATTTMMQDVVFLQNIAAGGILVQDDIAAGGTSSSSLNASFSNFDDSFRGGSINATIQPFSIDVSGLGVYPDAIPPNVQAVVAASTHGNCLTAFGMIPCIPPVANWSKGSSASEGLPKVGIPLMVHATALEIQKLSDHLVFGVSANEAYVVGHDAPTLARATQSREDANDNVDDTKQPHQRIILTMSLQPGSMSDTPRVGLVQPGQPVRIDKDDLPSLYITGNCTLTRSMDKFWKEFGLTLRSAQYDDAASSMAPWSVALQDQGIVSATVLPFFLALPPPGKLFGAQESLYLGSIRHLHDLYIDQGQYAARLIHLLCTVIETGGARVHEEVLQSGCIHILASSLRLSLIRANRINFFSSTTEHQPKDLADVVKRLTRIDDEGTFEVRSDTPVSPRHIPLLVVEACERLIRVCCGPVASSIEALSPANRVVRTSDLALTTVFSFALDFDLWGADAKAGAVIYKAVADRYGDFCITYGYIIRSQVSVQHLLDSIRVQYDMQPTFLGSEEIGVQLCRLLTPMLLASLSNRRSVSQAEHDVAACIRALTGASLGSLVAHIVLNALVEVLVFCDVFPLEVAVFFAEHDTSDEHKMQVAARMGRNVLMSEFLDIVGPIILSRTVSPGDSANKANASEKAQMEGYSGSLCWQDHWRLSLLLFSWIASIAGSEGHEAAVTTGRLLLASGYAGSLLGALDGIDKDLVSALYLPSPAVAQIIGYALRSDWSYHEMLADRLRIMIPLLPGMVTSLLPRIMFGDVDVSQRTLHVLANLLISIGGALQRVFGDIRLAVGSIAEGHDGTSEVVKSVKTLTPHLVIVAMLLENLEAIISPDERRRRVVTVPDLAGSGNRLEWSIENDDSFLSIKDDVTNLSSADNDLAGPEVSKLHEFAVGVLRTSAALMHSSFSYGGAGAAQSLWHVVIKSLEESVTCCSIGNLDMDGEFRSQSRPTALNVLCQLAALLLKRSIKRKGQWDVWSYEQASAVAMLCTKIEEAGLLRKPRGQTEDGSSALSSDQLSLMFALLEVLAYGRDVTGWCQLSLPTMTNSASSGVDRHPSTASKLMLPVLEACVRIVLLCLQILNPAQNVDLLETRDPEPGQENTIYNSTRNERVVDVVLKELDLTLTAAIVGLNIRAAQDVALQALAAVRKAMHVHVQCGPVGLQLTVFRSRVIEELRVRFQSETQLKERALIDYYDRGTDNALRDASDDSEAVEKLILGGVLGSEPFGALKSAGRGYEASVHADVLQAALEECSHTGSEQDFNENGGEALEALIDIWEKSIRNAGNYELTDLFDSSLHLDERFDEGSGAARQTTALSASLSSIGSETAADAVSGFFECAAAERARLDEISNRFLPAQRCNKLSYAERFCWARHMELSTSESSLLWERGIPDGNRDMRSRIPTVTCFPEFRRFVPSFLDHYAEKTESLDGQDIATKAKRVSLIADMDTFTKNLLETGTLEIVDITKKEFLEEDEDEESRLSEKSFPNPPVDLGDENADEYLPPCDSVDSDDAGEFSPPSEGGRTRSVEPPLGIVNPTQSHPLVTNSAFSTPPDNSSSSMHLIQANATGIEHHLDECLQVRAEGSRSCSLLLTSSHLILEFEAEHDGYFEGEVLAANEDTQREQILKDAGEYNENDPEGQFQHRVGRKRRETALMRPQSIRWNLSEVSHVYLRRYRLRDSALEIFFIPSGGASFGGMGMFSSSSSLFLDFGPSRDGLARRDDMAFAIMQRSPPQAVKQWPDRSAQFLHDQLNRLTLGWAERRITNFDYLLHLNMLSGRSYNDICQYPVFPWVLSNYTSETVPDLTDPNNFRDLSKPMGALNDQRLAEFRERFESFVDPSIPPFMYGSHYSTSAGVVLHFLVRLHPFAGLHRQLQSGHFDVADRLFSSVPRTWSMCTGSSAAEVKELTPEWYCNPAFLRNVNSFKLGTSQDGDVLGDVVLPPWAGGSADKFVDIMRSALESEICSQTLHHWIDLIFGRKQQGSEAIKANNVFFYLTYYGSVDVASIEDESLRQATELQIAHFGQCPMQLFRRHHISRFSLDRRNLSFYQCISAYNPMPSSLSTTLHTTEQAALEGRHSTSDLKPFSGSPISYWVHLDAPPPGPHGALISVRFAGTDRCLAVDDKGIFHTFRWAWRADEQMDIAERENGCFIAQRELPRFRSVPRLMHATRAGHVPTVAISKTLFAGRSVLLVLSDGDGKGGLGMQLVDPSKGSIRGEVLIPAAHSCEITCIVTDPIGTAAGHGGVGGELALVGSADGCASLWRFMSSHYLPLRPRARLAGHHGAKISAVALNSTIQLAATVSSDRFCLHSIGNGTLIRTLGPPNDSVSVADDSALSVVTHFADTPAVAISSQGFLVAVCESTIEYATLTRTVTTLNLFSIEGVFLGSRPMERWRGTPHRMMVTPDGTAVLVCSGRGVTVHRVSCCEPLEVIDEWVVTESDDLSSPEHVDHCYDLDLGPSLNRPVAIAAACSNGALRLHALPGISQWSERHKKSGLGSTVGNAFVKPAQTMNRALKEGFSFGSRIAGMGRDIGKEVSTDVKTAGVGGFLGNLMKRRNNHGPGGSS